MTLSEFLTARLDADERYIRAMKAAGERFRDNATPTQISRDTPLVREVLDSLLDDAVATEAIIAAIEAGVPNDLDRLLREVEAKRKILRSESSLYVTQHVPPTVVLKCLAAVYSDHPDYQPEWATA